MKMQSIVHIAVVISALLAQPTIGAVLPKYEIIDLGTLGGEYSNAYALNNAGQVVGISSTAGQVHHAFLWDPLQGMFDLGILAGGDYSLAYSINDTGQVVGRSGSYNDFRAFIWDKDTGMTDLGMLLGGGCSEAYGINNASQVVGVLEGRAFLWHSETGMVDLGGEVSGDSVAYAINNSEQVVGACQFANDHFHAFIWDRTGGMRDLGTLGGDTSMALSINNAGQVVGHSTYEPDNDFYNAFIWNESSGMVDLSKLYNFGSYESVASAINDSGQIVGTLNPNGWATAYYLDSNIGMVKLYDLLPENSGWEQLRIAANINNHGDIVGLGITDAWHAFLMIYIPPKTYYVDADATGANDGSSWTNAYNDLQDALAVAEKYDEIRVAQGIYKPAPPPPATLPAERTPPPLPTPPPPPPPPIPPADRTATFQLKNGVVVKGGYAGLGELDPNARDIEAYETILSGDIAGNDIDVNEPADLLDDPCRAENSYHVVTASGTDATAILDGFTITAGNASSSFSSAHSKGGGMYNCEGSPTITNCIFIENSAGQHGGGIYNCGLSHPTVTNCTFIFNVAYSGGGMRNKDYSKPNLTNCTFSRNSACGEFGYGGGIYGGYGKNTGCTFTENLAQSNGGGLANCGGLFKNCTIIDNSSGNNGGGIYYAQASPPKLINCSISGNSAGNDGGGIYWPLPPTIPPPGPYPPEPSIVLTNCTISGNKANRYGGGIYSDGKSVITNCILWDDSSEEIYVYNRTPVITYSNVQGGWPGEGNIGADPCFTQPGYWDANGLWVEGNYHLRFGSPCIDAGDPNYPYDPNETDLDGRPRLFGGRIDMGAYEYGAPTPAEVRIIPNTIKPESKGKSITAYLWPPEAYNLAETDCITALADYTIEADQFFVDEEKQVVTAKFNREQVQQTLIPPMAEEVELTISVHLIDGTVFEGTDIIQLTHTGGPKPDKFDEASNPNPDDGAADVVTTAVLNWTAGSYAQSHDVYFGTSINPPFVCNQIETTFDPGTMAFDTTYFWRIDELNKWYKTDGVLWSFTTGPSPGLVSNPVPHDGATFVDPNADLSWTATAGVISHDVYFGTSITPPFVGNQTSTTFDPGPMAMGTTYYWRIDQINPWGKATGVVFSFLTIPPPPP